jgi:hypothetical protein
MATAAARASAPACATAVALFAPGPLRAWLDRDRLDRELDRDRSSDAGFAIAALAASFAAVFVAVFVVVAVALEVVAAASMAVTVDVSVVRLRWVPKRRQGGSAVASAADRVRPTAGARDNDGNAVPPLSSSSPSSMFRRTAQATPGVPGSKCPPAGASFGPSRLPVAWRGDHVPSAPPPPPAPLAASTA